MRYKCLIEFCPYKVNMCKTYNGRFGQKGKLESNLQLKINISSD